MSKKALVLTMHKVGSSSLKAMLEEQGYLVDRGYKENIHTLLPAAEYEIVATAVRDPVARNISWFFEQHGNRVMQENMRYAQIYQMFLNKIDHFYPLVWFLEVWNPYTRMDVFDHAPYFGEKFQIYRTSELPMHRAETEETRPYGAVYHQFLEQVKLPKPYLNAMYHSKFARHFFNEDELLDWRKQWQE